MTIGFEDSVFLLYASMLNLLCFRMLHSVRMFLLQAKTIDRLLLKTCADSTREYYEYRERYIVSNIL
jgi:hypothetical protein